MELEPGMDQTGRGCSSTRRSELRFVGIFQGVFIVTDRFCKCHPRTDDEFSFGLSSG